MINFLDLLSTVILLLLSADHLVTGVLSYFFPNKVIHFGRIFFGANVQLSRDSLILLRPWGALGIFAGIIGLFPILAPLSYGYIYYPLLILLIMRISYRAVLHDEIKNALGISRKRNFFHQVLITLCVATILIKIVLWV